MALESILHRRFTHQSDVWSYGQYHLKKNVCIFFHVERKTIILSSVILGIIFKYHTLDFTRAEVSTVN